MLVHGAWHGAWCWDRWLEPLTTAGYRVRTLDLPGHGDPGARRLWTSLRSSVDALEAVVDGLESDVTLVGHSMGGLVVQRLLERRSVAGAVLLASVPRRGVTGTTVRQLRRHPLRTLRAIVTLDLWPLVNSPERTRELFFTDSSSEETVARTAARLQNESFLAYLSMMVRWPRSARVTTPVRVVAAGRDAVFSLAEQKGLAAAYGTDLVVVPEAGHDLMLDDTAAETAGVVARLIATFP